MPALINPHSLQDVFLFAVTMLKLAIENASLMAICTVVCIVYYNLQLLALQGGCITKLEQFLADHLLVIGAVGIGVACLQVSDI